MPASGDSCGDQNKPINKCPVFLLLKLIFPDFNQDTLILKNTPAMNLFLLEFLVFQ